MALRRLLAIAVLGLLTSCASPTLPLPPPEPPTVTESATPGMVHLSSVRGAESSAIIVIINRNPTLPLDKRVSGSQADDNGTWDADVVAARGDILEITQEFGSETSSPTDVPVP